MSVLVVGAQGNMGVRYQAILRFLGKEFACVDVGDDDKRVDELAKRSTGILIATPTDSHVDLIRKFLPYKKPILCEKPVLKNRLEIAPLFLDIANSGTPFRMMFQYQMLCDSNRVGPSYYDYYKHGKDGLYWDCFQIIALARQGVHIRESSPVWSCKINGQRLSLSDMDAAYVGYIQRWFRSPKQDVGWLAAMHEKVADLEKRSHDAH